MILINERIVKIKSKKKNMKNAQSNLAAGVEAAEFKYIFI